MLYLSLHQLQLAMYTRRCSKKAHDGAPNMNFDDRVLVNDTYSLSYLQDADLRYRFIFNHFPTLADEVI